MTPTSNNPSDMALARTNPALATSASQEPTTPRPVPFRATNFLNGLVPWLFLVTGPYLIILHAAQSTGVPDELIVSWFMAGPIAGGTIAIVLSAFYRVPVCSSLTVPGSLLAVAALGQLPFQEAVGAYMMTGILVGLLALTGLAERLVNYLPISIVFAMVAGVFTPFIIRIPEAAGEAPLLVGVALLIFLVTTRFADRLGGIPPTFWAAVAGIGLASLLGQADWTHFAFQRATPVLTTPQFTLNGLLSLSIPLTMMVVGVHGTQSAGITRGAGFPYATRTYTLTVGAVTVPAALLGTTPLCILGPPTAMLLADMKNEDDGRWAGGVSLGVLLILFGLFSPLLTGIPRWLPQPLIASVAGLAIMGITGNYLRKAFSSSFTYGPLFAFGVTLAGVSYFNVGAPLWGLLSGLAVSAILEPEALRRQVVSR